MYDETSPTTIILEIAPELVMAQLWLLKKTKKMV
jgi:hypothetical protein